MLSDLLYRLRAIFRRRTVESELDDELRFHFEHKVESALRSGIPRHEAVRRARLEVGGLEQIKEDCRQVRGLSLLETIAQDVHYAVRVLVKNPGFTLVAALTLAAGIGANTAIFSVVNAVLLRPLPYPEPDRLVMIWGTPPQGGRSGLSEPTFFDFQEQNHVFDRIAEFTGTAITITGGSTPERVPGGKVTPDFFEVLKVRALLGRTLVPEDAQPSRDHVLVISYGLWQRRFGGDRGIVGQSISINLKPYTVIGILPADFTFSVPGYFSAKEAWVPAVLSHDNAQRGNFYLRMIARLKPGMTHQQAQADLNVIGQQAGQANGQPQAGSLTLVGLHQQIVGDVRPALWILMGAVGLVLLIACANVANLQLARASARRKEIGIRAALGAGRSRIVQQLLTETLLVALLGGVMGGAMAWWGLQGLAQFAPVALPRDYAHSMNGMVLGYTAAIALLTGILFGLAPALQSSSARLIDSLKQGGRTSSESGGGRRLRGFLMIAEVALSLVLLIGAGLLIRSFLLLVDVKPGFDAAHVLSVQISLPEYAYRDDRARVGFYRRALEKLRALPGVVGAGAIDDLPLTQDRDSSTIAVEGLPPSPPGQAPTVQVRSVTPDYFRAMGIPQLAGRAPSELDTSSAPPVVVVNQTLARRIFPKEDPIGRRLAFGVAGQSPWMTIVGVVGDVHDTSLASQAEMEVYQPYQQSVAPYTNLVLRTPGDPAQLGPTVLRELHGIDKDLPLQTQPMDAVTAASVAQRQFQMLLLSLFALLALVLAAVGIYGVVSYSVAQRINEIGVRMALGARRSDVLKLVVGHSLGRVATGAAFGLLASLILTKLLSAMLYGIGATDPLTLGAVVLLLAAVAALASYVPARRAMKVDPMTALRSE